MKADVRGRTEPKVRAAALTHYLEVASALSLDPAPLLREAGIARSWLQTPDQPIPADAVLRLLEASAHASGCEAFGLLMAESRQLSNFGAVSLLITHQRTLRDVLQTIVEYRHALNDSLALYVEPAGRVTVLREEVVTRSHQSARQGIELAVAVLFRVCRKLSNEDWRPQSVHFTHSAPADLQVHRRLFRCTPTFDSDFNGFVCLTSDLDRPNPLADPVMADYAARFVAHHAGGRQVGLDQEIRRSIYLLMPMGRATIVQVAQGMGLNVRTLQRRLDEIGLNFKGLVQEVRRELAPRYIGNERYPLGRVAEQLGYTKPSSFTRWFSEEFGMPPAQWRLAQGKKARRRQPAG